MTAHVKNEYTKDYARVEETAHSIGIVYGGLIGPRNFPPRRV